ncbi:hypothetical protein [Peribacillus glennii]|uniref:Uncharacterized protein n=1 Tax=Peribacillus glennii TaxID=2303991 RepID=A0A372LIR8_9BACI|nr:hypothetical protein [Peribacillus glennii]RFU65862.1 hypothetical protein D0466_08345 [Peribacillus glennii]
MCGISGIGGLAFDELTNMGIFYPKQALDLPCSNTWERSGIRQNLQRLGLTEYVSGGKLSCNVG